MTIGRRSFLSWIGIGAAAAPAAPLLGPSLTQEAISHEVGASLMSTAHSFGDSRALGRKLLGEAVWKLLEKDYDKKRQELQRKAMYRVGVVERDIDAMRSWSPAFKLVMQEDRDNRCKDELNDMAVKLWPSTDDD